MRLHGATGNYRCPVSLSTGHVITPDDHLQHVLEQSVSHLSYTVRDMVVDRATNRVRKAMNFSLAPVMLRYKAQGGRDKRQGWVGDFFYPAASQVLS